jgi:sRNA-binding carbon storage regulator CsrA
MQLFGLYVNGGAGPRNAGAARNKGEAMLAVTLRAGEGVEIGEDIVVRILRLRRRRFDHYTGEEVEDDVVRIGIEAPKERKIWRLEGTIPPKPEGTPPADAGGSPAGSSQPPCLKPGMRRS